MIAFKSDSKIFNYTNLIILLATALLLLDFFSIFQKINIGHFFNSDSLYLPSIYRDIFVDKNGVEGWHFNPAPNFFPDMLFYFGLMFLTANNFIVASFLFGIIQYFVLLFLFIRIFKLFFPEHSNKFYSLIFLILSLILLEAFYFTSGFIYEYFLLSNAYHTGSFVMTLWCLFLTLKYYQDPKSLKLVLIFILGFLATVSDKLFIIQYAIPVLLTSAFFLRHKFKTTITIIINTVIFVFLGLKVFNNLSESNYIFFDDAYYSLSIDGILNSFNVFVKFMSEQMNQFSFFSVTVYLFIVSIIGIIVLLYKTLKSENIAFKFYLLFILFYSVFVIITPILCGNFGNYSQFRYNIYPLYLTGLNLTILIAYFAKNSSYFVFGKYITFALAISLLITSVVQFNFKGLNYFFTYYPETAKKLDLLAEKDGLLNGVADYWVAKSTTMFSKKGVKVYAVFEDMGTYHHVANQNWFYRESPKFNFVILNGFSDTALYQKRIPAHKFLSNEPDLMLVKTNVFSFNFYTHIPEYNDSIVK